MTRSYVWANW